MREQIARFLNELIRLELATIRAYEEAIEGAESVALRAQLTTFMSEHHNHVGRLRAFVIAYGGTPAERRNLSGYMIEAMTAILAMGDYTALLAMRRNEEITTRTYYAAARQPFPEDVHAMLVEHYTDEVQHLSWIVEALHRGVVAEGIL